MKEMIQETTCASPAIVRTAAFQAAAFSKVRRLRKLLGLVGYRARCGLEGRGPFAAEPPQCDKVDRTSRYPLLRVGGAVSALAQDIPSRPGMVKVTQILGGITVKGYDGKEVVVEARFRGSKPSKNSDTNV